MTSDDSRKAPRVAVIGAGPIGIEAALEGVRRGFDVVLYDAGRVAEHWRRFEDVRLFTPFRMNSTPAGRERLRALRHDLPSDDAILTAGEIVARYLEPLARLPELEGRVREQARVTGLAREAVTKSTSAGRSGRPFLLRVGAPDGTTRLERADIVIDATGVYGTPCSTGPGGLPAPGEEELGARIDRHIVPFDGEARDHYAGKRVLLIGDGHSAATALLGFAAMAERAAAPSVTWIRRGRGEPGPGGAARGDPFLVRPNDPLSERASLATRANRIAREAPWIATMPGAEIESYAVTDGAVAATLRDESGSRTRVVVDQVLALVGYRPDPSIHRELRVHLCYGSEGPMALAAAIDAASAATPGAESDCLKQTSHGAETLRTTEPGFFLAGAKSYGRNPTFLLSLGHRQIEEIYGLIEADAGAPPGREPSPRRLLESPAVER